LKVDPELALRRSNGKFRSRFAAMESATDHPLEALDSARLEELWAAAKLVERADLDRQGGK
jgi:ATP diphosphatase